MNRMHNIRYCYCSRNTLLTIVGGSAPLYEWWLNEGKQKWKLSLWLVMFNILSIENRCACWRRHGRYENSQYYRKLEPKFTFLQAQSTGPRNMPAVGKCSYGQPKEACTVKARHVEKRMHANWWPSMLSCCVGKVRRNGVLIDCPPHGTHVNSGPAERVKG